VIREPHDLLRVDEDSNEDDDESEVATCDAETNTECNCSHGGRENLKRHGHKSVRASSIRRSQTFSPHTRHGCDYICKVGTAVGWVVVQMGCFHSPSLCLLKEQKR